ncbi:hypothetical protein VYU27_008089 [Nannochloropsis oceanica]
MNTNTEIAMTLAGKTLPITNILGPQGTVQRRPAANDRLPKERLVQSGMASSYRGNASDLMPACIPPPGAGFFYRT